MGATISDNAVCVSWILVTEWTDGEGNNWLEEHRTAQMPPWKRQGILWHILEEPVPDYEDEE